MIFLTKSPVFSSIAKSFALAVLIVLFIGIFFIGLFSGYLKGKAESQDEFATYLGNLSVTPTPVPSPTESITPTKAEEKTVNYYARWGGPDLWSSVNKRRGELGVNSLNSRDELCTTASIRLNELMDKGTLDGHEGFSKLSEQRSDLRWIFEKYSVIAEFLALGGETPEETVTLWENTLGHRKLLTGGEYVWGCVYAQNTFAVAIVAY